MIFYRYPVPNGTDVYASSRFGDTSSLLEKHGTLVIRHNEIFGTVPLGTGYTSLLESDKKGYLIIDM